MKSKKLIGSLPAKCAAFFLCVCFALAALFCACGALYFYEDGYYSGERTRYAESSISAQMMYSYTEAASRLYYYGTLYKGSEPFSTEHYERMLDPANTNYRYAVYNAAGERIAGTAAELGPVSAARSTCSSTRFSREGYEDYDILSTLDPAMAVNDRFAMQERLFSGLLAMRYGIIVLGALCLLLALVLFVFLLCAAGRHAEGNDPECRNLDRVPFDVYLLVCGGIVYGLVCAVRAVFSGDDPLMIGILAVLALIIAISGLIAVLMSFAARVKCRSLFHNTVIGWVLRWIWRFLAWCCRGIRTFFTNLPLLWRAGLFVGTFLIIDAILLAGARRSGLAALLFILWNIAFFAFSMACVLQMRRLQTGAKALEAGDFSIRIEEKRMFSALKQHAEALNGVGAGLGRAVEARMRSERMKTDLITNVSHDLKTPLTSIVNYVDLLKKQSLPAPADEYVAVLERQAQRLKKLAEDVVEASKASSGVMNVNMQPTDIVELVEQSMAEYAQRFQESGLTPVAALPDAPLIARADGRLLWRAVDNLLSNAVKYALTGTRVYIAVEGDGDKARISIKNVSREPLNIEPAELTERFVRGDSSRAAEGSGLGLSIAQSLVALQSGTLTLSIDGDLFKADIVLSA